MPDQTLIELLYGKAAHANPLACLQDVSLELAGRRTDHFPHSIFQLTSHMNYWIAYDLRRIRGEMPAYHNSYHIGQIAMLCRALGAWFPPSGGDSW